MTAWFGYAVEGLDAFCSFSDSIRSAYGWDQDDCDEMQRILAATQVFLWLLITMLGLTSWTSWQLSEVVQSVGIDEARIVERTPTPGGVLWSVGRTFEVAGLKVSGMHVLVSMNRINVNLLCCLGSALLGFTIALHPDNNDDVLDGQLNAHLQNSWAVVSALTLTLLASFVKSSVRFLEAQRVMMFLGFCQIWLVGTAFHSFFFLNTYDEEFSVEEYLKNYVSFSVGYSGIRRGLLLATAVVTGLIWTSQILGTMFVFLELPVTSYSGGWKMKMQLCLVTWTWITSGGSRTGS